MRPAKILITFFLVILFAYVTVFTLIEHRRVTHGPWLVTFNPDTLVINQPRLGITNVELHFATPLAATNLPQQVIFDTVQEVPFKVPGGECVFLDLISHPGNVTLKLCGHIIQMLPRDLTVDGTNHAWQSGFRLDLPAMPPK